MGAMLSCLFLFYWIKVIRWKLILSPGHKLNTAQLAPAMMAGAAGNNLLPAHMGELIRTYFLGNQLGIPKSTIFATLVVERLFDIGTVLALLCIALPLSKIDDQAFEAVGFLLFSAIAIIGVGYLLTTRYELWVNFVHRKLTFLTPSVRDKLTNQLVYLTIGLKSMQTAHLYLPVLLCSFLKWLLMALCIYFSLVALDINISPFYTFIILGLSFFGTIEYCFVLGLATANVDPSIAVSAAIYYHVPMWLAVTFTGLLAVKVAGYSFKQLKSTQ